jgi:tetratricopeptide (TPR) repeat protein
LENLALKKALTQDPESGLYSRRHFGSRLNKLLGSPSFKPEALMGFGSDDKSSLIVAVMTLGLGAKGLDRPLARILRGPKVHNLARLDQETIGLTLWANPTKAPTLLADYRRVIAGRLPAAKIALGYATFPGDHLTEGRYSLEPDLLLERARTALRAAANQTSGPKIVGFGDLVAKHGQITQILPPDRAVINLGRAMGAKAGQIYAVLNSQGETIGEIAIFETSDHYSLAKVQDLGGDRLNPGDRLSYRRLDSTLSEYSGLMASELDLNGGSLEAEAEESSGLINHEAARANLDKVNLTQKAGALVASGQTVTVALMAIDEGEKLASLVGPGEIKRRLNLMAKAVSDQTSFVAAAKFDELTIAALLILGPDAYAGEIERIRAGLDFPVSLGLAYAPFPVVGPNNLLAAAKKALVEAAMTGPTATIVFGPQSLNIAGDHLFEAGDLIGAKKEFLDGLILEPNSLNLLNSLGVCHGRLGEREAALQAFDAALAQDPTNPMALFNKGCSLILTNRLEEALTVLAVAAANPNAGFEPLFQYGRVALELGRLDAALPTLRAAASQKDRRGVIWAILGQAELLTGESDKALEALKKAVKHDPDDARSLSSLGVLFLERANDREVALSLFQRSVEIDPTNALFRQRLGKLLFERGDFTGATHHLKAAVEYGCQSPEVQSHLLKAQVGGQELESEEEEEDWAAGFGPA